MFKVISVTSARNGDLLSNGKSYYEEEFELVNKYLNEGWTVHEKDVVTPPQSGVYTHIIFTLFKRD